VTIRFTQVFFVLMAASLLCSLGMSQATSDRLGASVQSLFAVVSGPVHWFAGAGSARIVAEPAPLVEGSDESVRLTEENWLLRRQVQMLTLQIESIARDEAEKTRLGQAIEDASQTLQVIGAVSGGRELLRLVGSSTPVAEGDVALFAAGEGGLAGRVQSVGAGNQALVRLVTDPGSKLLANFGRFTRSEAGPVVFDTLMSQPFVLEGRGQGEMKVDSLKTSDVQKAGIKPGDLVVLAAADEKWSNQFVGFRVGVVTAVEEKVDAAGFADIRVRPETDLLKLRDVLIVKLTQ